MLSKDYPHKLKEILETLKLNLSEEEIDRLTDQFSELGSFLVRLNFKKHLGHRKLGLSTEIEEKTREPPVE